MVPILPFSMSLFKVLHCLFLYTMVYPGFLFIAYADKISVLHVVSYHFYEIRVTANLR